MNETKDNFSTLTVENGTLQRVGSGSLRLPTLTVALVVAMLTDESHGDTHPTVVFAQLNPTQKDQIEQFCQQHADLAHLYRQAALDWAPVRYDKEYWDGPLGQPCYTAYPRVGYFDEIQVLTNGQRLVRTGTRWRTFAEFAREFGKDPLLEMLHVVEVDSTRVADIVADLNGEMVIRRLSVVLDNNKIETREFNGLGSLPSNRWQLPPGVTFMSEA